VKNKSQAYSARTQPQHNASVNGKNAVPQNSLAVVASQAKAQL
jgi:hypothetical protein